jgi:hypothetical protein
VDGRRRSPSRATAGKEYGGLQVDQARKIKDLERENARLRRLMADLSLVGQVPADVASGNV